MTNGFKKAVYLDLYRAKFIKLVDFVFFIDVDQS